MSTRIRYTKNTLAGDNQYISNDLTGNGKVLSIVLFPQELSYRVFELNGLKATVLSEGTATTMQQLKILAKKEAKALGVQFNDEVRKKRTS